MFDSLPLQDFALKYFNTNFRAQTNDALRVLRAVEALGGRATVEDIAMLVKVRLVLFTTLSQTSMCDHLADLVALGADQCASAGLGPILSLTADLATSAQGVVAEQNTRLAGPMFDVVCRYEEDLGDEMTSMLFCALLEMLLAGKPFLECLAAA